MKLRRHWNVISTIAAASNAADLKYNIKPKQVVPYEVFMAADRCTR